jgi:hypothetical protein
VQLYALKTHTAEIVANTIVEFITRFGVPEQILLDQGTEFQSNLISEIFELLDIQRLRISPYHPETDGLTERFNRTLKTMLTNYNNETQSDWDEHLNKLAFAYNISTHSTTTVTPFELMFGRKAKLPIDIFYDSLKKDEQTSVDVGDRESPNLEQTYVKELSEHLKKIYQIAASNQEMKMQKAKIWYDQQSTKSTFKRGDLVLVRDSQSKMGKSIK